MFMRTSQQLCPSAAASHIMDLIETLYNEGSGWHGGIDRLLLKLSRQNSSMQIPNIKQKGGSNVSVESAKAFVEKMKKDAEFAKKVTECKGKEAREAFVKEAGFVFTAEDLKASTSELTDEELEAVAGGNSYHDYWCKNVPGQ